jgi:hypothetical protein
MSRRIDLIMMAAVLVVTVIGLKVVGLVLIVALLIIPPVAARFWTEQVGRMIWISGAIGGGAGYVGAAVSASAPDLPTGPIIVLVAAAIFVVSLLLAPVRGLAAAALRQRHFKARVHQRQGLLALARQEPIREAYTLRLLQREGLVRADGVPTEAGRAAAAKVSRDERRWDIARQIHQDAGLTGRYDGLTPIEDVFTADEIRRFRPADRAARRGGRGIDGGRIRPVLADADPDRHLRVHRLRIAGELPDPAASGADRRRDQPCRPAGIVVAFLLTGLVAAMPMLLGAAGAASWRLS